MEAAFYELLEMYDALEAENAAMVKSIEEIGHDLEAIVGQLNELLRAKTAATSPRRAAPGDGDEKLQNGEEELKTS